MNIYYDKDCDLSIIQGKKVTVVGYGSQGHAHANNLKDSGVDVTVALREGSTSAAKAEAAGLTVKNTTDAIRETDVVMVLTPDEFQRDLYVNEIEPHIKPGAALAFAHGFAIHFNQVEPRADLDVIMIAPKAPGHTVRSEFVKGGGIPDLIAIQQDASGMAKELSKPLSEMKPKPIFLVNKAYSAEAPSNWSRPDSKPWSRLDTHPSSLILNVCTN